LSRAKERNWQTLSSIDCAKIHTRVEIHTIATAFRRAIESCDRASLPSSFNAFPLGSCDDAAALLGRYFHEHGLEFLLVAGSRGSMARGTWNSHAWLSRDRMIVDITADQYPEITETVLVTEDQSWHSQFRLAESRASWLEPKRGVDSYRLTAAYRQILSHITDPRSLVVHHR
jgi:hypothetical protein